jgi:hypothetical protein
MAGLPPAPAAATSSSAQSCIRPAAAAAAARTGRLPCPLCAAAVAAGAPPNAATDGNDMIAATRALNWELLLVLTNAAL